MDFNHTDVKMRTVIITLTIAGILLTSSPLSFEDVWEAYKVALRTYPILTKSMTSATINILSDTICQRVERSFVVKAVSKFEHSWVRTAHTAITGFAYSGPFSHFWYQILERIVTVENRLLGLFCRSFLDATIFSPLTIAGYFTVRTVLEGTGIESLKEKLRHKWILALIGAWKFWPIINLFNFALVPLQFRVLYVNIMSLLWTGYLSYINQARVNAVSKKIPSGITKARLTVKKGNHKKAMRASSLIQGEVMEMKDTGDIEIRIYNSTATKRISFGIQMTKDQSNRMQ